MQKRKLASNFILFLFFILVGLAAVLSDIFKNPIKTATDIIEQTKLFNRAELNQIKRISLKNKSGEYIFTKYENGQASPWKMISPREIYANSLLIENIFKALTTIKVKTIFPEVLINNSNFSIDKPTATLELIDQLGKSIIIKVGLMNTIDNSTYFKIAGKKGIYHVEAPEISLEKVSLLDLIESQIFSINIKTINNLKITHNKKLNWELVKENEGWIDSEKNILNPQKIDDFFQELSTLRSAFILDKQSDAQKKQIILISKTPEYIITTEDNLKNTTEYKISGIIKYLSDIDFKNEEYFVVTISNSTTAYVVKKEFNELFSKKIESLRTESKKN